MRRSALAATACLLFAACRGGPSALPSVAQTLPATRVIVLGQSNSILDPTLLWLATHQREDGSWSAADAPPGGLSDDVSATALALSAILSAGYTNRSGGPLGRAVADGLRWLKSVQDEDGYFRPRCCSGSLRHDLLATSAMLEAYGMTGSVVWRWPAQRALDALAADRGRWMPASFPVSDDAVEAFGWGVCAVESAQLIDAADKVAGRAATIEFDATILGDARDRLAAMREAGAATTQTAIAIRAYLTRMLGSGPEDLRALERDLLLLASQRGEDPGPDLTAPAVRLATLAARVAGESEARDRWVARTEAWVKAADRKLQTGAVEATAYGFLVESVLWYGGFCWLHPFPGTASD